MRRIATIAAAMFAVSASQAVGATVPSVPSFDDESRVYQTLGELPKRGSLSDVVDCAAANEVLWTTLLRANPRDPAGHEAKRKAGWYAAVAFYVFALDSAVIVRAVADAEAREPRSKTLELARRCRKAPDSWRE